MRHAGHSHLWRVWFILCWASCMASRICHAMASRMMRSEKRMPAVTATKIGKAAPQPAAQPKATGEGVDAGEREGDLNALRRGGGRLASCAAWVRASRSSMREVYQARSNDEISMLREDRDDAVLFGLRAEHGQGDENGNTGLTTAVRLIGGLLILIVIGMSMPGNVFFNGAVNQLSSRNIEGVGDCPQGLKQRLAYAHGDGSRLFVGFFLFGHDKHDGESYLTLANKTTKGLRNRLPVTLTDVQSTTPGQHRPLSDHAEAVAKRPVEIDRESEQGNASNETCGSELGQNAGTKGLSEAGIQTGLPPQNLYCVGSEADAFCGGLPASRADADRREVGCGERRNAAPMGAGLFRALHHASNGEAAYPGGLNCPRWSMALLKQKRRPSRSSSLTLQGREQGQATERRVNLCHSIRLSSGRVGRSMLSDALSDVKLGRMDGCHGRLEKLCAGGGIRETGRGGAAGGFGDAAAGDGEDTLQSVYQLSGRGGRA